MNDTEYGLTAGVYTPDRVRAEKILAQVHSGSVYWNCCDRVSPRLRFTLKVVNLFNRRYATFGQLGINEFTGPGRSFSAYSETWNSNDQFRSYAAPRAAWVGVAYEFK